jgi:energy-coupling factor transport system substrate-specific component
MKRFSLFDLVLMTMYGALMFVFDIAFEALPNIHGVALIICVITLIYRWKASISIGLYIALNAIFAMSATISALWWVPYIYIFPLLWLSIMLIPKKLSLKVKIVLCTIFAGLNGLAFGTLYAPFQAIMFGLSLESMIAWIVAGLPFDLIHMCSNVAMCSLIYPLYKVVTRLEESRANKQK